MEDTDLCWRIWLQNSKVILIPESVVYHKSGASSVILPEESKYLVKFHGTKNYVATLLKNFELKNLLKILPLHLCGWMSIALFFLFHKKLKSAKWISQGILWNFIHFRSILEKRRIVQKQRLITDDELFSKIVKKQSLGYFLEKLKSKKQVGYAVGWDRGF
jgi:GT2 family glycosyltransferase